MCLVFKLARYFRTDPHIVTKWPTEIFDGAIDYMIAQNEISEYNRYRDEVDAARREAAEELTR